jgi:hypothetical protein
MVTPTPDVSNLPSLPTESSSPTTIEADIGKPLSIFTEISDAPMKSGDGSDSRTAPIIATEDLATADGPNTLSHDHQIAAAPVDGTVIKDPSGDTPTSSDESTSEDRKTASSSLSDLATPDPPPSESASPDRAGNSEGLANPSPPPILAVSPRYVNIK